MSDGGERLPWLSDDPALGMARAGEGRSRKDSPVPATPPVGGRSMWPFYLLLLLLIGAVGLGAWWLGTRQRDAAPPQLPAEQPVAVPMPPATERVEPTVPVDQGAAELAVADEGPATPAMPKARPAPDRPVASSQAARPGEERADRRSVFPADEPASAPPPATGPQPVVVYHPQTDRGRVIQLGAYADRKQAEDAWRKVTRRYPYLSTKPRMINTVDVRGLGSARRTRMYRLQLGTSSQAQSAVICQQLERAGQSCVVVY